KFIGHPVNDSVVKVFTTKESIPVSCFHFEYTVSSDLKNRNVECTTTKVEYSDVLIFFDILTIGQSCSRWLVNNTFYIKTSNTAGIFSCLSLSIVEVGRNCNDSFGNRLAKIV